MKDDLWPELDTLHALWLHIGQQHTALPLMTVSTLAFRAIRCEEQCRQHLQAISSITTFTDVYSYCEALELLQQALETWIEAEVKLTIVLSGNNASPSGICDHQVLASCINQQQRLIATYLLLQQHLFETCTTHHILLTSHLLVSSIL